MFISLKRLASYYKPYKALFFSDIFFALLGAAITLSIPLLVRYITETIPYLAQADALRFTLQIGATMAGLALVEAYCNFYIAYYGHIMGAKIERDMRNEIFNHYQKLSFTFYDNQKTGHLLSRVTTDLFDISELMHHGPEDLLISFIKFTGASAILFTLNWKLTLILISFVPFLVIFAYIYNRKMKRAFKNNRARIADINSQIEESLAGIRVVKSFGNENEEIRKFHRGNERFVDTKKISYRYMGIYHSGMNAFTTLITVAVMAGGAFFMAGGKMSVSDLITFMLYVNSFTEPVRRMVFFTEQFQNGYSGYERFMEILAIAPDIEDAPDAVELPQANGRIIFDNVSFRYTNNTEVLRNIDIKVESGEYVAIVGGSGAGKTTLCSLIPRFYDVSEGAIYIDDIDVRKIKLVDLRNQIGIVQQDVYLFGDTVMENIRYGKPNASDEEVVAAAKLAGAHDFIVNLESGYYSDIGQRGIKLSGGQKQRLSIARVFLKNPPILIFDEATSSLDNETEKIVQDSLEKLAKSRTTFVIAHRLSTIRNAKRIIVLDEDGVKEEGSHEELIAAGGDYAKLYDMQFKNS
ncbi:MAG: ABC transporter ATP-binding protein/permease [Leptospirales bacterium]|nr:ABC transporter ATP-binding protein/permease [Leptospirales bacterium]